MVLLDVYVAGHNGPQMANVEALESNRTSVIDVAMHCVGPLVIISDDMSCQLVSLPFLRSLVWASMVHKEMYTKHTRSEHRRGVRNTEQHIAR